ncbi:hypothetical protein [Latilactobacillus graminis]|uniref:Uncharacterized protein n=2 Tax=Latilactobacillus graminis TaxID=60519 RepID=A0AA89L558_9LACO|nr:hypothetical protein [Latilactobacillus graminis]KRM24012.1 hypothetical protein FC90_GL001254 [Latilactobacillus graminis DSM 20719]QFP79824.1 hypothetical protein LG542_06010 [Latilactobacillus graminis]
MNQWIYVILYQANPLYYEKSKMIRAFSSEQRAQEYVALLNETPYANQSLKEGHYIYQKLNLN